MKLTGKTCVTSITKLIDNVIASGSATLILPGAKLSVLFAARRVNYMDVIHNPLTSSPLPEIASCLGNCSMRYSTNLHPCRNRNDEK